MIVSVFVVVFFLLFLVVWFGLIVVVMVMLMMLDGVVDLDGVDCLVCYLLAGGCDGIVVVGIIGEVFVLIGLEIVVLVE